MADPRIEHESSCNAHRPGSEAKEKHEVVITLIPIIIHAPRPTRVGNVSSLRTGCGRRSGSRRSVRMQGIDQGVRAFVELVVSRFAAPEVTEWKMTPEMPPIT
jgi:hypothetical protein